MILHFTQLVRDEAYAVGCAILQFKEGQLFRTLVACDYSMANILNHSIYRISLGAGSGCKQGINTQFPGLCSTREIYESKDLGTRKILCG